MLSAMSASISSCRQIHSTYREFAGQCPAFLAFVERHFQGQSDFGVEGDDPGFDVVERHPDQVKPGEGLERALGPARRLEHLRRFRLAAQLAERHIEPMARSHHHVGIDGDPNVL